MNNRVTAYYLYCLTPGGCGIQSSGIGVDGQHPVSVRDCGEIGAVLSEVELAEFCGESAERRSKAGNGKQDYVSARERSAGHRGSGGASEQYPPTERSRALT